ncbi:MAG: IS21-like element helper ATPase IstB [bacterium]
MQQLQYQLKAIRLSAMAQALPVRLQQAKANELPHMEFLATLVNDELEKRKERLLNRRIKAAQFPQMRTIDEFDFNFNPVINKRQIRELASCRFVHSFENILLLGPPGVGKTHLAIAFGIAAIDTGYTVLYRNIFDLAEDLAEAQALGARKEFVKKLVKPNLLIIDEFGMKSLPANAAEDLLEIIHRRYRLGASIIATNRPIEDWGKILGDNVTTSAILDRFMDGLNLIKITGRSYRVKSLNKNLDKNTENH